MSKAKRPMETAIENLTKRKTELELELAEHDMEVVPTIHKVRELQTVSDALEAAEKLAKPKKGVKEDNDPA